MYGAAAKPKGMSESRRSKNAGQVPVEESGAPTKQNQDESVPARTRDQFFRRIGSLRSDRLVG